MLPTYGKPTKEQYAWLRDREILPEGMPRICGAIAAAKHVDGKPANDPMALELDLARACKRTFYSEMIGMYGWGQGLAVLAFGWFGANREACEWGAKKVVRYLFVGNKYDKRCAEVKRIWQ